MEKLKKVFSPGSSKDDEVLYGDAKASNQPERKAETLHPMEGSEREEHVGDKHRHDDQRFGTTATTEGSDPKYDQQAFGTTAAPAGEQSSLGRDAAIAGGASAVGGGAAYGDEPRRSNTTSGGTSSVQDHVDRGFGYDQSVQSASSTAPADSQNTGQPAAYTAIGRENPNVVGTTGQTGDNSHLGRDAALAGGAGALGAGGVSAATRDRDHRSEPSSVPALGSTQGTLRTEEGAGSERHLGKEGAIVGTDLSPVGAGFLGLHDHNRHSTNTTTTGTTGAPSTLDAKPQTDGLADGRSAERAANEQSGQHNYGRDTALASSVAAGGVLGTHEADKHSDQRGGVGNNFIAATGTAPISRPLDGDSNIATGRDAERSGTSNLPNEASRLESTAGSGITGSSINPVGAPESTYAGAGQLGSTGIPAGSGVTEQTGARTTSATPGSVGALQPSSAPGHGHINPVGAPEDRLAASPHHVVVGSGVHNDVGSEQLNQAPADVQAATYTYSSQHVGDRPNGPHVPGEFPREDGTDPHETSRSYGTTAGGSQVTPLAGTSAGPRDHAAAGAGTAAGLTTGAAIGGIAAHDSSSSASQPQQSSTLPTAATTAATQPSSSGLTSATAAGDLGSSAVPDKVVQQQQASSIPATASTTQQPTTTDYPIRSATNQAPLATQQESQHNYGRDAGIAGGALGAGALGAGAAFAATQGRNDTGPSAIDQTQSTSLGSTTSQPAYTTLQPDTELPPPRQETYPSTHQTTTTPTTTAPSTVQQRDHQQPLAPKSDNNHGRDAALAGGAGALGAGTAYEATRDRQDTGPASKTIGPHDSDVKNVLDPRVQPNPELQGSQKSAEPTATSAQHAPHTKKHAKHDSAMATGGAVAAYGTTHEVYGEDDPNKHNKLHKPTPEEKKHDKELEKEQKKHEKEGEKEEKKYEKEEKKQEKEIEKEHKKAEKEGEKEEKKAEKEGEKEEKKHEKVAEKEEKKHEKEVEKEHKKAEKEAEKENKPSLIDRILHPGRHHGKETEHVSKEASGHNKGDLDHPLVGTAEADQAGRQGMVTEPHTGLPMNVEKYGSGSGGTDGAQQIAGYHEPGTQHATVGTGQGAGTEAGHAGPDWDAIKKENTPY